MSDSKKGQPLMLPTSSESNPVIRYNVLTIMHAYLCDLVPKKHDKSKKLMNSVYRKINRYYCALESMKQDSSLLNTRRVTAKNVRLDPVSDQEHLGAQGGTLTGVRCPPQPHDPPPVQSTYMYDT